MPSCFEPFVKLFHGQALTLNKAGFAFNRRGSTASDSSLIFYYHTRKLKNLRRGQSVSVKSKTGLTVRLVHGRMVSKLQRPTFSGNELCFWAQTKLWIDCILV